MHTNTDRKVYGILIALVLIWGLAWPISKVGLLYMDPIWYSASRFLIGMTAGFIYLAWTKKIKIPQSRDLPLILTIGVFQMALFLILLNSGLLYVGAGRASILVYTTPIWVTPVAAVFFKESLGLMKSFGLILGIAGLATLFSPFGFDWSNANIITGNLLLAGAAIVWAGVMLHMRYGTWHSEPADLLLWQMALASVVTTLAACVWSPHPDIQWTVPLIGSLLYNGLLATAFAYWASMYVTKSLPVITTSMYFLGVPVVGLISSVVLLGEELTLSLALALTFIVTGLALIAKQGRDVDRKRIPQDLNGAAK